MPRRLHKTLIDYLVIAISPAMIIAMIGSLVFFLLEVFYRGQHDVRLSVIFGLFVMAAVLVGRIAIEEGKERAGVFAVPLAIVTFVALCRLVELPGATSAGYSVLVNLLLIALIWWCAHKLTWDCTLIDESERDTGEGLLESAGLDRPKQAGAESTEEQEQGELPEGAELPEGTELPQGTTSRDGPRTSWWQRYVEHQRRPHAPGVWVVYFSLAALPLFGLGQKFVPEDSRQYAFNLLFVYVASGLGLLLSTSFLGLRRYLRQRRVEMPAAMANLWLLIGAALIVVLLVVVGFLPRPGGEYSISDPPLTLGSPDREPDRVAVGKDGVEDKDRNSDTIAGDAQRDSQGQPRQSPDGEPSEGKSEDGDAQDADASEQGDSRQEGSEGSKEPDGESKENGSDREDNSDASESQRKSREQAAGDPEQRDSEDSADDSGATKNNQIDHTDRQPPSADPSRLFGSFAWLKAVLKWILWGAMILGGLYWLWRSRGQVLAALRDFLQGWREFWQSLFGGRRRAEQAAKTVEERPQSPPRPFAAFSDPFAGDMAGRFSPDELVRYSFEALEAWGREHDCARDPDQTPHEFARRVGDRAETVASHAQRLADLYCLVAYAPGTLPAGSTDPLRQLWSSLRQAETAALGQS